MRNHTNRAVRVVAAAVLSTILTLPLWAQRGSADFTRYVALGDSYTAGIVNSSLVLSHQQWSIPAQIARQAGTPDFQQPLVSQPGIPPELRLVSISPLVIAPKATENGAPINLGLRRPYNNLGIPGARVGDLLTLTGAEPATGTASSYAQFILRGLGTAADQALAQNPTFLTVWIGGNDVLGAVLAGTPAALTPLVLFESSYNQLLDRLVAGAPNAGMVVGSVADVSALPFATTIPPVIINPSTGQPVLVDGAPVFFIADLGGGNPGVLPPGSLVTLGAASFLASGFGIPAQLAPFFPPLPNIGRPLPDAVVLTPTELATIQQRVDQVNEVIFSAAAARNIPVVDMRPLLNDIKSGIDIAGVHLDGRFLVGGVFSYDGFHPNDIGYTLLANHFISTINSAYGTDIPQATLAPFFANNGRFAARREARLIGPDSPFNYTREAWMQLLQTYNVWQSMRVWDFSVD